MAQIEEAGAPQDFDAAMRASEEAAGIPSDEELYGPMFAQVETDEAGRVPSPSPPRDDEGNPVPVEERTEPVEAAGEGEEETEGTEAPAPVLPPGYDELQRKVGILVNENAELRKAQEERQAQPVPVDPSWYDQALEADPAQAVALAVQAQDPFRYEQSIRAWYDVDPVAAGRYERQVELGQLQQTLAASIQPQLQAGAQMAQKTELDQAIREVSSRHEDFDQVVGSIDEQRTQELIQGGFPVQVLAGLTGSLDDKRGVLETLYRWVKTENTEALIPAAVEAQVEQAEKAKAAKRAATVASASTTTPPPVTESEGERLARVWQESRPSLRDGWQGRPER